MGATCATAPPKCRTRRQIAAGGARVASWPPVLLFWEMTHRRQAKRIRVGATVPSGPQGGGSHTQNWRPQRHACAASVNLAPSYLGGAVARVAPMCANVANSAEATAGSMVWFIGRESAGALPVTARHSAKPVSL